MSSKFKDLMAQARSRETDAETDGELQASPTLAVVASPPSRKPMTARRPKQSTDQIAPLEQDRPLPSVQVTKRRGRPRGKRSHPDFEQITAYISKQTYRDTKIALLQNGEGQQFSELVENLLGDWLKSR